MMELPTGDDFIGEIKHEYFKRICEFLQQIEDTRVRVIGWNAENEMGSQIGNDDLGFLLGLRMQLLRFYKMLNETSAETTEEDGDAGVTER